MYKSEIRSSTINSLLEKAANASYGQYLPKLILQHIRGFNNEPVSFDFPVTAVIGPNGGGKTTILGAAGCAYKVIAPKLFFSKSGKYDESMQNWNIDYEIIDRKINKKDLIRRNCNFQKFRWRRQALDREVLLFGVSRTVPANERREFLKCASSTFTVPSEQIEELTTTVRDAVGRILGKDVSGFRRIKLDRSGRFTFLTGKTKTGAGYSEFHFGAGESSIIKMVSQIESAGDQALVLIEEIENGLHPVATIRMVEYLIEVAERKKIQAIFTTHSNYAIKPLPSKAIWVATQDKIFQGKLDIESLRAITGEITAELVVFVEDNFAKTWTEAVIRQSRVISLDSVGVYAMEGDGTAVLINKHHQKDPSSSVPSICLLDGDSRQAESESESVFRLPGQAPESFVFDEVLAKWSEVGGKLSVALLQRFDQDMNVKAVLESVRTTNLDPHLLYAQVGERLGLIPESTVVGAFTTIWAQVYPDSVQKLLALMERIVTTKRS